jgi:hypothetical protein
MKNKNKINHEDFKREARKMFMGQFPNTVYMRKPTIDMMNSREEPIIDELLEFLEVTIDKYKELVK